MFIFYSSEFIEVKWTGCSSLTLNGQSCETSWNRGSFISTTTSQNMGVYDVNTWTTWTSPWYEWASPSDWLSCAKGYYLQYKKSNGVLGTWSAISGSDITLNLFVKASPEETNGVGSYSNPFGNIAKAISYAQDQTADKGEATVNICKCKISMICVDLLKGDHFMTRNYKHYNYDKSKESKYSYNININLQPAFWGETL